MRIFGIIYSILLLLVCKMYNCTEIENDEKSSDILENTVRIPRGNILFFHHAGSQSHLNFIRPLAKGLADHGHNVTIAQFSSSISKHENITEVLIKDR